MQDKILDWLRKKQDYLSGDQLSQRLGISRQALWKHIQQLKDTGYEIVAVPHLGYRLASCPDRLFPSEITYGLNTKIMGKKIYYFDILPSTNEMASELGIQGAPEGTLVLAEGQSRGHGRLGRNWFSPKYKGIYLSLILRPGILPALSPVLTLIAAVSICEAIKENTGLAAQIKWPNDIFLHNKKLGGILTELNAEMDIVRFVVIGIGLNVNNDKRSLVQGGISLREEKGEPISRVSLTQEILRDMERNYLSFQAEGSQGIIEKWRNYSITLGRRVRVSLEKRQVEGEAIDIDADGGLLVRTDAGLRQKIISGDIIHCR